jgi:hypothetical protein
MSRRSLASVRPLDGPDLPKPQQHRLEALVERETTKFWRRAEGAQKAKRSKESNGRKRTRAS